jgi:fatty acid desaturase
MVTVFVVLWFYGFDADGTLNVVLCAPLLTLLCLLAIVDAVISHNHNHAAIFRNRWANLLVGCVISLFYGFPSFCWIPTHNQNHHVLNNRPGDYSITTRPLRRVGLLGALLYPTVTSLTQARLISPFLSHCWRHNRFLFWRAMVEYAVFSSIMIALFIIDWRKALLFAVLPQQVALFFIQHFNYLQHIETDSFSGYGHSRNFTGRILNYCLFNNGYHTVHHMKPGLHWSLTPRAHAEVAHKIPQRLLVENFGTFWLRRFVADVLLRRAPCHMTLPAALSPDTLRVTERGTAMLGRAYLLHGLAPASGPAKVALGPLPT